MAARITRGSFILLLPHLNLLCGTQSNGRSLFQASHSVYCRGFRGVVGYFKIPRKAARKEEDERTFQENVKATLVVVLSIFKFFILRLFIPPVPSQSLCHRQIERRGECGGSCGVHRVIPQKLKQQEHGEDKTTRFYTLLASSAAAGSSFN